MKKMWKAAMFSAGAGVLMANQVAHYIVAEEALAMGYNKQKLEEQIDSRYRNFNLFQKIVVSSGKPGRELAYLLND